MKLPSLEEAKRMILEAEKLNPGPWVDHSINVAKAAKNIAEHYPSLNPQHAYLLGFLHDIGRREGVTQMHHILAGYYYLKEKGYDHAAKISLTHSFSEKDINTYVGKWDCTEEEINFIREFLSTVEYDDYDLLIQLCDALASASGFCLIEKRLLDVALRHEIDNNIIKKWKSILELQKRIEEKIGISIYEVLPGVVENTFGMKNIYTKL